MIRASKDHLFTRYFVYCIERDQIPLSKTYFFEKIISKQYIHFTQDESICEYCHDLKYLQFPLTPHDTTKKKKLDEHVNRWHKQGAYFKQKKEEMVRNRKANWVIIVQDFTQLQVQGTFFQDLIICLYFLDINEKDSMGKKYLHFVAPTSLTKNDYRFVVGTWMKFIEQEELYKVPFWIIFSDGGPKHFKLTATVKFFGFIQNLYGVSIEYNFFESNHGHSICDAVASQAKKNLSLAQRDNDQLINTPNQIVTVLKNIKNHNSGMAETCEHEEKFDTFHGIRSCHKFVFTETEAIGYYLSEDQTPSINFVLNSESFSELIK